MKQFFYPQFLLVLLLATTNCNESAKKEYVLIFKPLTTQSSELSLSDQGIQLEVRWKAQSPVAATAMLFDGANNPVWNQDYPKFFDGPEVSSRWNNGILSDSLATLFSYDFTLKDKPGTWRFILKFGNKEMINYPFEVAAPRKDPSQYTTVNCFLDDGKINLSNFYQLSEEEKNWLNETPDFELVPSLRYAIQTRIALCLAPEFNYQSIEDYQHYLEKISNIKLRQINPKVDSAIEKVMPVFREEFLFVNPDMINWFSENMVPDPGATQMNDVPFQSIYEKFFRDRVHALALQGLYYRSFPEGGLRECADYARVSSRKYVEDDRVIERTNYFDLMGYITEHYESAYFNWYHKAIAKNKLEDEPTPPFNAIDLAFWMRRRIDGSHEQLWFALSNVLKKYDLQWYNQYIEPNDAG